MCHFHVKPDTSGPSRTPTALIRIQGVTAGSVESPDGICQEAVERDGATQGRYGRRRHTVGDHHRREGHAIESLDRITYE